MNGFKTGLQSFVISEINSKMATLRVIINETMCSSVSTHYRFESKIGMSLNSPEKNDNKGPVKQD